MNAFWKLIKEHAKTVAAFVAGILVDVFLSLAKGETPWPQTGSDWLQLALTSFGPAITVWATRNKITQKQLDKDPNVVGGVVVPDAPSSPSTPVDVSPPASGGLWGPYA